jgi:hypothetical protein
MATKNSQKQTLIFAGQRQAVEKKPLFSRDQGATSKISFLFLGRVFRPDKNYICKFSLALLTKINIFREKL